MKDKAVNYYKQVILVLKVLFKLQWMKVCVIRAFSIATAFSGGMSSGCLCGAVAGAQWLLAQITVNKTQKTTKKRQGQWQKNLSKNSQRTEKQPAAEF